MKIIEIYQEYKIICDNPACDYKVKNESGDPNIDCSEFINKPCPICGENLLTKKDHLDGLKLMKIVNKINKYLGWLSWFIKPKKLGSNVNIHVHNGVKIGNNG